MTFPAIHLFDAVIALYGRLALNRRGHEVDAVLWRKLVQIKSKVMPLRELYQVEGHASETTTIVLVKPAAHFILAVSVARSLDALALIC